MLFRREVLSLYCRILRVARTWESLEPCKTETERDYIRTEAQSLFKRNKNVRDEEEIKQYLQEGEARLEMALHYKIPYPRHVNFPQHMVSSYAKWMKGSQRRVKQSRPIYVKSLDKEE